MVLQLSVHWEPEEFLVTENLIALYWVDGSVLIARIYASRGSDGFGNLSQVGSTPQISRAYSSIVRSLENLPLDAMLWMAISNHFFWFCNAEKYKKTG